MSSLYDSVGREEKQLAWVRHIQSYHVEDAGNENLAKLQLLSELITARERWAVGKRTAKRFFWNMDNSWEGKGRSEFQSRIKDIFPELVWKNVLGKLEHSKDKLVVSNMTGLWSELLKDERTHFLFHEVFPVIYKSGHLPTKAILSCRSVSNEWKQVVDKAIQPSFFLNGSSKSPLEHGHVQGAIPRMKPELTMMRFFGDFRKASAFRQDMERNYTGRNPFPSRSVQLGFSLNMDPRFAPEMEALFSRWGGELRELSLCFHKFSHFHIFYEDIVRLARLTPNLKALEISFTQIGPGGRGEDLNNMEWGVAGDNAFMEEKNKKWRQRMISTPLPELPQLVNLGVLNLPVEVVQAMLNKYGATLEILTIGGMGVIMSRDLGGVSLPKLNHVYQSCSFTPGNMEEGKLIRLNWPSTQEALMMFNGVSAADVPRIFHYLNGFGPSLRHLSLMLFNEQLSLTKVDGRSLKMLSLNLPQVEQFTLFVSRVNLKNVDFLLPMTNLKVLVLHYNKFVDSFNKEKTSSHSPSGPGSGPAKKAASDSGELIELSGFTNRLYESNIWRIFPDLRRVTIAVNSVIRWKVQQQRMMSAGETNMMVKKRVYDREGYVKHKMNRGNPNVKGKTT